MQPWQSTNLNPSSIFVVHLHVFKHSTIFNVHLILQILRFQIFCFQILRFQTLHHSQCSPNFKNLFRCLDFSLSLCFYLNVLILCCCYCDTTCKLLVHAKNHLGRYEWWKWQRRWRRRRRRRRRRWRRWWPMLSRGLARGSLGVDFGA